MANRLELRCVVRPYVCIRPSVRTSTKSFFSDFDLIWCVCVLTSTRYADQYDLDPIQGQGHGHGASELPKIALLGLSPPPFSRSS